MRRLGAADIPAYRLLRLRGLLEHPDAFVSSHEDEATMPDEQMGRRLIGDNQAAFGAFVEGQLVGTASTFREVRSKIRHKAWLVAVYVAPEARGRGVGRAVCSAAIGQARAWPDVEQIHLGVASPNEAAVALYRSLGFEQYGHEPRSIKLPDRYVDEYLMVLRLDRAPT